MLESQNNVCKVCNQPEKAVHRITKQPVALSVDHCHTTGKIRGLLCSGCNTGIGKLKDSPEILSKAIEYLNYHKNTP